MSQNSHSKYQVDKIQRYYSNLETIMLQKLSELVTEMYLADSKAKQTVLWERAHKAMLKLKVKPFIVEHIMKERNVEILAKNLQDWLVGKGRK